LSFAVPAIACIEGLAIGSGLGREGSLCWNLEVSIAAATLGFAASGYAVYKREAPALWMPLGYFSVMEALQAYGYGVVNGCHLPANQLVTYFSYLHIVFQPFFINMLSLHFIPATVAGMIRPWSYAVCFAASIAMLTQLYPFEWAGSCVPGTALCSQRLCTVSGTWHIAWGLPINGLLHFWGPFPAYVLAGFIVPVLYGSWRITLFHLVTGPLFALVLTGNMNEWPAVWCLLSVGLLLLIVAPPIRRTLYVHRWPWPRSWQRLGVA
jgi:hypothetical protein